MHEVNSQIVFHAAASCPSRHMAAEVGRPKYGHENTRDRVGGSYLSRTVRSMSTSCLHGHMWAFIIESLLQKQIEASFSH